MREQKDLSKILTETSLEWNQNVKDDLLNILKSIDPRNLEQIVEHISIAFSEFMSDYEVDSELWEKNGITKDNYKKYCSYKVLGRRYFVIKNLINEKSFLNKLDSYDKNAFFSPKVLAINIAWHGLLLKLIEDYEEYSIIQHLFAKREESIKKEKIIWVKWFPEEVKEALLQYKMYILETAKFIVKYKLPINEDSQVALAKFIEEMKNEVIADLKTEQNSKIISDALTELLKRFPDISQKSKQSFHSDMPSLISTIFKSGIVKDETIPELRLQNALKSLPNSLKTPELNSASALIQKINQAMDSYQALCNNNERKSFKRHIAKPIKIILGKLEILASINDLLTTKKELNYKKEKSSTEETKHKGPPSP